MTRRRNRGQTLLEFTFVGIPMIFTLISIFEISRGMWIYHTLAYSVKVGVRYASVHGLNCGPSLNDPQNPNNCLVTMGAKTMSPADCNVISGVTPSPGPPPSVATAIWCAGVGLDPSTTTLTFTDNFGTTNCALNACPATTWPTPGSAAVNNKGANNVGSSISIQIQTPFKSMIAMFWPGAKPVSFAVANLPASSSDLMQF